MEIRNRSDLREQPDGSGTCNKEVTMATLTKKDIIKKWENLPDDAEVRIFPDWVNDFDYLPVKVTGYIEEFNMIIIEPKYGLDSN